MNANPTANTDIFAAQRARLPLRRVGIADAVIATAFTWVWILAFIGTATPSIVHQSIAALVSRHELS